MSTDNENTLSDWRPPAVLAAAERPLGPGRTVWLASYPKSGNTWMRAIVTAMRTHHHFFAVNHLGSGAQPHHLGATTFNLGMDPRWMDCGELDALRVAAVMAAAAIEPSDDPQTADDLPVPILRKTHEIYRAGLPGREPFPLAATRAAILVVRDPRDVACSYAPFFGLSLDEAIDALGENRLPDKGTPLHAETAQPWGSWTKHGESWLAADVPFPVFTVRYEDLKVDATSTLSPVFKAIGMRFSDEDLHRAVEQASFERLQASEQQRGFRETARKTRTFFRRGRSGGWREELSDSQAAAVEADHLPMLTALGYPVSHTEDQLQGIGEVRQSRRRQKRNEWLHLPEHMGIDVRLGDVPEELPEAIRPRPWIQVTQNQALVSFSGGVGLLVSDGKDVTVKWQRDPEHPETDPSWLVQGWAVTLAMLQRGDVSLHAATLDMGGQTVAIAGHRGAGKSTTSMGLRSRGHRLLIDDVTLVEFRGAEAWTTPYSRNVHLLPDAAEAMGLDFHAMPLLAGGRTKVAFRAEDPPEEPHKIDHIIVLAPRQAAHEVTISPCRGSARIGTLTGHLRRDGIAPIVLGPDRYFSALTKLANSAPVWELSRPRDQWTLSEVLDRIEEVVLGSEAPR